MTRLGCERAWEAAALDDGRLSAADGASFERHRATCAVCAEEQAAMVRLKNAILELPVVEVSALERRRGRNVLLRRANVQMMRSARASWWPWGPVMVGVVAASVIAFFSVMGSERVEPDLSAGSGSGADGRVASDRAGFHIAAAGGAEWKRVEHAGVESVELKSGRVELSVEKVHPGRRFLVVVPDGELEVRGTRFAVEVARGTTREVSVFEGCVEVRIAGQGVRELRAGDRWFAKPEGGAREVGVLDPGAPASSMNGDGARAVSTREVNKGQLRDTQSAREVNKGQPRDTQAAREVNKGQPRDTQAAQAARARKPRGSEDHHSPELGREPNGEREPLAATATAAGATTPPKPSAGTAFKRAMAAFSGGDFGVAEQLFIGFAETYPDDSRVEDAAFLSAVARARRGDTEGARALARDYLRRYPDGLRREDAERLLRIE